MPHKHTFVDLFCGCGGFSLGGVQAGFECLAGIDIDANLLSAYGRNFRRARALQADLSQVDSSVWKDVLHGRRPTGVIGGPPCQPFSRMGKQDIDDKRNQLVGRFFQQVGLLRPSFFIMENVEGLLDEKFTDVVDDAMALIPPAYTVLKPMRINASLLGAPTERYRVIIVGYLKDEMASLTAEDFSPRPKRSSVTVWDAISDLPSPVHGELGDGFRWNKYRRSTDLSEYQVQMRKEPTSLVGWGPAVDRLKKGELSGVDPTMHTPAIRKRFAKVAEGETDPVSRYPRLKKDGLCPTLRAGTGADRGSFQAARPIHPTEHRVITVREAARLQGFPDAFVFHPTLWHSFRMIGNSVPPLVGNFILERIKEKL